MRTENYNKLTAEELDLLAKAYLECRLSKLREMELAMALGESTLSTPAIEEARESLGLELGLAAAIHESGSGRQLSGAARRKKPFAVFLRVAACVAAVFVIAFTVKMAVSADDSDSCLAVYVDGAKVSSEVEARKIAESVEKECMAMLRESQRSSKEEYETCMTIIKELKEKP